MDNSKKQILYRCFLHILMIPAVESAIVTIVRLFQYFLTADVFDFVMLLLISPGLFYIAWQINCLFISNSPIEKWIIGITIGMNTCSSIVSLLHWEWLFYIERILRFVGEWGFFSYISIINVLLALYLIRQWRLKQNKKWVIAGLISIVLFILSYPLGLLLL